MSIAAETMEPVVSSRLLSNQNVALLESPIRDTFGTVNSFSCSCNGTMVSHTKKFLCGSYIIIMIA